MTAHATLAQVDETVGEIADKIAGITVKKFDEDTALIRQAIENLEPVARRIASVLWVVLFERLATMREISDLRAARALYEGSRR